MHKDYAAHMNITQESVALVWITNIQIPWMFRRVCREKNMAIIFIKPAVPNNVSITFGYKRI